jgi:FlaA1/EpsC-like NDP-sugar epimerase
MGCTKRLGELMVLSHGGPMRCWAVRFGNVVGSRGSVVPIFERQIQAGGPVTITHPDMTRYMMTINEAASLVIHSLRLAKPGHLYMLDMGEPISILSLAQTLIRSRGLRPGSDIEIVFTGLRPGERLTEEILGPDEGMRPTSHQSIMEVISPTGIREDDLNWVIGRLSELAEEGRKDELVQALKKSIRVESLKAKEEEVGPIPRSTFEHDPV